MFPAPDLGLSSRPVTWMSRSDSARIISNYTAGKVLAWEMRRLRDVNRNLFGADGTTRPDNTATLPQSTALVGARHT